jgi:hypothetical protein
MTESKAGRSPSCWNCDQSIVPRGGTAVQCDPHGRNFCFQSRASFRASAIAAMFALLQKTTGKYGVQFAVAAAAMIEP